MIQGQRITLRQWKDSDLDSFAALNTDPQLMLCFLNAATRSESADYDYASSEQISAFTEHTAAPNNTAALPPQTNPEVYYAQHPLDAVGKEGSTACYLSTWAKSSFLLKTPNYRKVVFLCL